MFEDVIIKINELDFKNEFIIDEILGRSYTYCEFFSQALLVADFIENSVVGDSVIAVKENSYELALLYFSVMLTTKRILVVDPQKGKDEIKTIVDELDKTSIFLDGKSEWSDAIKHEILNLPELREPDIDLIEIKQKVLDKLQRRNN